MMLVFGMTGPIGHGKTTFSNGLKKAEPSSIHLESFAIVAEVANALHASMRQLPNRDDIESINDWLKPLPAILLETVHVKTKFDDLRIELSDVNRHPIEYEKLLLHIENLHRNPELAKREITRDNKETYRPLLQFLGGYLVKKVGSGIWYEEIVRRARAAQTRGVKLCIIGGLRYPNDARLVRSIGGKVVKVYRPGHLQYDVLDPTERERENIEADTTVVSDGTIADMDKLAVTFLTDAHEGKLQETYHAKGKK